MKNRIVPLARKEIFHILRDPRSLYLSLIMPVLLVILFGYAITFEVRRIDVGIVDRDHSSLSRRLISEIGASQYFHIRHIQNTYSGLGTLLDEGRIKIILAVPSDFSQDLAKGNTTPVQLLVDGSDNNTAQIALGYLSKLLQGFSSNLIQERLSQQEKALDAAIPPVGVEPRVWYNPGLRSTHYIVPGLIAVVMMILTAMLTSLTIAREWETGTMEQLIASPAKPHQIITGKLLPYFFLGLIQISLVILTGILLFKVPLRGNLLFLFGVSSVFLVCGLAAGLLVSTVTKSQQLAFMLSIIFTLLPSFILSGFAFPISSMPSIIQIITYLVPAKYFLIILRGIFLKGSGLAILWPEVVILFGLAAVILLASIRRLRLSLE